MVFDSCQKKSVLLWDIVFLSLISKLVNVGRVFVGISVGVLFRKLKPLSRELWGMRCSWEYCLFFVKFLSDLLKVHL